MRSPGVTCGNTSARVCGPSQSIVIWLRGVTRRSVEICNRLIEAPEQMQRGVRDDSKLAAVGFG